MKTLRLILGDQLHIKHSWFNTTNNDVTYCLFELEQESTYVTHHIQKVIGFFAAMRQFYKDLESLGHQVIYIKINDEPKGHNLEQNLSRLIKKNNITCFEYMQPDEYRLDLQLSQFTSKLNIKTKAYSTEHFYTTRTELSEFFKGKKQYLMENFYRYMRKKHNILIIANQPEGGKWNYDKSNRKPWKNDFKIPPPIYFENNVSAVLKDIKKANINTIGHSNSEVFHYPISRIQALQQLEYFCEHLLIHFGDFQDAMDTDEEYLFHSRLAFALNIKLIRPKDIIKTVLNYYRLHSTEINISQVEGFIRQIIGWREYMRGMYWAFMPEYKSLNTLENYNPLPKFFWTGQTKMNCLKQSINNSLNNSYAHHIQRLMITGNFALLTQTNPNEVDNWYLGIYIDAIEWVQLPNTRGMSQFADGGKIATKPYVSSGSYINKMSTYCKTCTYNKNKKTEADACPFNSLYWNFLDAKRNHLEQNFRMKMMYSLLNKMDGQELHKIKQRANHIINNPDAY
ncbi:cryptochrome/photolyase family protein [Algibacter mikhailovii]|uniref:Cryptochrome/photolyase family protein n=1 Tax=Algibacter mikhailovii TaxID=425498 RepID=A0A918R9R8_9FLAO|nr:cryptochrome/photolyase family protein [Algibacter mikhailovii]GGZ90851.1 cryptochrome/photolyase family protein [Algibacter mikhailovii]